MALLADEIRALRDQGYTYARIAEVLGKHGVPLSPGTLSSYMSRAKRKQEPP